MRYPTDDLPDLGGRTVLIAETNPLIALDLAETLRAWRARPLLYDNLSAAEQAAALGEICAALVDMSQFQQGQAGLVEALQQHHVPIVLTTAWQLDIIGNQFPGMTILEKPVNYAVLAQWFKELEPCAPPGQWCCTG